MSSRKRRPPPPAREKRGVASLEAAGPWLARQSIEEIECVVPDLAGVARGKIYLAHNRRERIPEGWAIDKDGAPTTDPQAAIEGIILPMAGHKGYAIAMMVDVLSGVLTGGGFLSQVHSPYKTAEKSNCGHFMIAVNIEALQPLAQFNARMEQYIEELKSVPLAQGHDEVFYPGEIEANNDRVNRRDGILLPEDTLAGLAAIAADTGLRDLLPF